MNDPVTTGIRRATLKHPGTAHSVYFPTGEPPLPAALVTLNATEISDIIGKVGMYSGIRGASCALL
jgi:hypothetical protein